MKILIPTFEYIKLLSEPTTVTLRSEYKSLDGVSGTTKREERHFSLDIPALNTYQGMDKDQDNSYGLFKPFQIETEQLTLDNPKGAANVKFDLNGFSAKCKLQQMQSNIGHEKEAYYRLVLPRAYNNNKDPYQFISSVPFKIDNKSSGFAGLIRFQVGTAKMELFNCDSEGAWYLVIDCITPITFESFYQTINPMLFSVGFVTGELHRNEMFILGSQHPDLRTIDSYYFEKLKDTVSSGMEVVSPWLWYVRTQKKPAGSYFDQDSFSRLTTAALKDKRLLRTLTILNEGNAYPFEVRASAYCVALETIKNIIVEENQEKINPFKQKEFAKTTVKHLTTQIEQIGDEEFNDKSVVLKRLQQLNQVTNKDSFIAAFQVFNFTLTKSDKEALKARNDFLHGRIPFEDGEEPAQELKFITYKMHYLASILILKHIGFKGWIRNSPIFFAAISKKTNIPDETLFVS